MLAEKNKLSDFTFKFATSAYNNGSIINKEPIVTIRGYGREDAKKKAERALKNNMISHGCSNVKIYFMRNI